MGCPVGYRNKSVAFTNGYMTSYDGITYEYDGFGRRVNINNLRTPLFDSDDNIVDDYKLTYIYDSTGVVGCYNGTTKYLYRKDTLGNIIAILDTNGLVVAKYAYDAWGNHKVVDASGVEITDLNHVAIKNPFRYRSYYYDTETGQYILCYRVR